MTFEELKGEVLKLPHHERARLARELIESLDEDAEIEPAATPMSLVEREGTSAAVPEEELPPLTDDVVRATLERTRR